MRFNSILVSLDKFHMKSVLAKFKPSGDVYGIGIHVIFMIAWLASFNSTN